MGCALADAARSAGLPTTLLLGPTHLMPTQPGVEISRFVSCADLERLLATHAPHADIIIMAAAVADYRPRAQSPSDLARKIKRSGEGLTLELEATPDLIAGVASRRPPGQLIVGFALEPEAGLVEAARAKLTRKRIDMVVGNPLETMESKDITATVLWASGRVEMPAALSKPAFAGWLIEQCLAAWKAPATMS
jgi:phosphopantothenoylcysteine decarboxylase/phosphopantothenate--cysteine ligase